MSQTRICSFFKSRCQHYSHAPVTFLELPQKIRDRIYLAADVLQGSTIGLIGSGPPPFHTTYGDPLDFGGVRLERNSPLYWTVFESYAESMEAIGNLSLCNSQVSADVARFLFSNNEVLVCRSDWPGLNAVLNTPPSLFSILRTLTVHLTYHPPDLFVVYKPLQQVLCCHRLEDQTTDPSFRLRSPQQFEQIMCSWRQVLRRLAQAAHVTVFEPNLNIYCLITDEDAATCLLKLLEEFGFAASRICFGPKSNFNLQHYRQWPGSAILRRNKLEQIASEIVLHKKKLESSPFRFLDLPRELRQHILSFAGLVTPLGEVYCHESKGFQYSYHLVGDRDECKRKEFCARDSIAYPHCGCWTSPGALFMVCKEMLEDARAVFYSSNRFIMPASFRVEPCIGSQEGGFFRFSREALPHLRSLEILFPAGIYEFDDFDGYDEDAYHAWIKKVAKLARHCKSLELRLYLTNDRGIPGTRGHRGITFDKLFEVHEEMVSSLRQIKGLRDCFVRARTRGCDEIEAVVWPRGIRFFERVQAHEEHLEKLIMGDGYDSVQRGKNEQEESAWMAYDDFPAKYWL